MRRAPTKKLLVKKPVIPVYSISIIVTKIFFPFSTVELDVTSLSERYNGVVCLKLSTIRWRKYL